MLTLRHTIIALALATFAFTTACNQRAKELEQANQTMMAEQSTRDSLLSEFMNSYDAIEQNLNAITVAEDMIWSGDATDPELKQDRKETVIAKINSINSLLDENKRIIADLERRAEEAGSGLDEYRRSIRRLQLKVKERETTIAQLKTDLEGANYQVAELNRRVDTLQMSQTRLIATQDQQNARLMAQTEVISGQDLTIASQTDALNEAFVAMGTAKELREKQIIDKEGGFLGIGRKHVFNPSVEEQSFAAIDVSETQAFSLDAKKAKLVTTHPQGTYTFTESDGRVAELKITDPEGFWETSKYLVVVLN